MQNVGQETVGENQKLDKVSGHDIGKSSTPQSSNSSPTKSESDPFSEINPRFMSDCSESEDDDVSEVESFVIDAVAELDDPSDGRIETSKFLLAQDDTESSVDPETHARLEALLEAAGIGKLATGEGKQLADPEVLRRLTSSVSCALDEAAAALTRMRSENPRPQPERSLVEACTDGDVGTVRKLLTEGRSVNETTEEGESLLSLACSAGYYELAQVLLAMHANVEDRGIKGDCTPLMEAASSGYVDIVRLLIHHGADVNAQSTSGNTPLMYACAGGHVDAVKVLLDAGANVEDHNENGHTPLMEAASAGHVSVAAILLERGAGINTHSNEFKESALTLACYKGHLDMVRFLLEAGADQEHKTDEMHTALMEASMDGHVEVARLLLDSGAQVNMPTDSFESPLTLAACGGHVELALLLIERGANIEEVNDEGYTPLMEAAREGHEEMVSVLLSKGANINAQTEETQETALTLACCGGFLEVADFLIKNGADIELGASTPLMEAAQEGHLELVRYLLNNNAKVNTAAQTGDTALTYACENGHTEVARLLIQYGADLEHESEGGRTPLMKACRAGHLCTVKYLLSQKANVNKQTANNDHTPLSLAAAGGHIAVVELLLSQSADPFHKLKDNSTMLIEAAKGGHTNVVQLLLDFPHSIMMRAEQGSNGQPQPTQQPSLVAQSGLHDVPDAVRALPFDETKAPSLPNHGRNPDPGVVPVSAGKPHVAAQKSLLRKSRIPANLDSNNLTSSEIQQVRNQPGDGKEDVCNILDPQFFQRQQIVEELQRVEQELKEKGAVSILDGPLSPTTSNLLTTPTTPPGPPPESLTQGMVCGSQGVFNPSSTALPTLVLHGPSQTPSQPTPHQPITTPSEVVQGTAISDRPKAKPAWKGKEGGKNVRKQQAFQAALQQHSHVAQLKHLAHSHEKHLSAFSQHCQPPAQTEDMLMGILPGATGQDPSKSVFTPTHLMSHVQQQLDNIAPTIHLHHDRPTPQECELLQRRCLADQQAILDLAKSGKIEQAIDETLDGINLDDVMSEGWKRDAFLAGMEAQRLAQVGQSFQIVTTENRSVQVVPEPGPVQVVPSSTDQSNLQYHLFASVPPTTAPSQAGEGYHLPCQMMQELQQITEKAQQHARFRVEAGGALPTPPAPSAIPQPPTTSTATTVATTPSTASFQSQLILKAPPPCKLPNAVSPRVKGAEGTSGGREQVQAGTQTSPASETKKPVTAPPPNGKTKKPRFQLQPKANQPPSIHIESNQSYSIEGQVTSAPPNFCMDVDSATDSNNDTALTLACAGGHEELVELLLSRGANIEHRDKKGFTPLILAATAGHEKVVEILLNHSADMEAQSERTKDTPLSLACSGGRYEVVELLLARGANKEHRNVSDYTPLSLAASGGYVNIIRLLLSHGAEINSRTGSKLGISPLMLAAMNGHTAAVKLLLDMGSDINAQIETNRNTALTLACFQGRHEVVSLLLDRKANVEHRAKTGLTPLMEAASGGYVEVGRVLLDKGADVNAPPVPSSRDTALTISADKGHCRFVELLLNRSVQVEVKNKKGNSPLWLAANGGHLNVVELLYNAGADIDSQDNRKVSCLMAAFRKGHVKVVKWMVNHVTQFPSDQEMTRYISTVNDKDLLEKCQECTKIIRAAKDQQAAKANKNATILLEELHLEKTREESKRAAAARKREKKKKKKLEKKEEKRKLQEENQKNERMSNNDDEEEDEEQQEDDEDKQEIKRDNVEGVENESPARVGEGEEGDSGIDANSQGSCSSNDVKAAAGRRKEKKKKKGLSQQNTSLNATSSSTKSEERRAPVTSCSTTQASATSNSKASQKCSVEKVSDKMNHQENNKTRQSAQVKNKTQQALVFEPSRHPADREDFEATGNDNYIPVKGKKLSYMNYCEEVMNSSSNNKSGSSTSPKQGGKRDEGWKEVVRKYLNSPFRSKKVSVPLNAISRVIGRGGSNINAIRSATGALIEVEKQSKGQGERIITLKGSTEATKQANFLINALIKDPDVDILQILPKSAKTIWEKSVNTAKSKPGGIKTTTQSTQAITAISKTTTTTVIIPSIAPLLPPKTTNFSTPSSRVTAPRLVAAAAKRAQMVSSASSTRTTMSYTSAIMAPCKGSAVTPTKTTNSITPTCSSAITTTSSVGQTFAAKLTDTTMAATVVTTAPSTTPTPVSPTTSVTVSSPSPVMAPPPPSTTPKSSPPQQPEPSQTPPATTSAMAVSATSEYSLFNDTFTKVAQQSMWGRENDSQKGMNFASVAATGAPTSSSVLPPTSNKYLDTSPPQVDASKAPGYRGTSVCSPVSKGTTPMTTSTASVTPSPYFTPSEPPPSYRAPPPPPNVYSQVPVLDHGAVPFHPGMSRLNPRAPDFSTNMKPLYQGAPPYIQPQAPPILANISFPLGKYAVARPNGGTRWPYPTLSGNHYPQGGEVISLNNLASMAQCDPGDLLGPMENGNSPNVSPSSPQPPNGPPEDRKIPPRPIGTERAWKYNNLGTTQEVDMTPSSWMMDKIPWPAGANMAAPPPPPIDRHMFRQNPPVAYSRIPTIPDEIQHLMDTTPYQGGLDGVTGQYNGGGGLSVMHSLPVLPQPFGTPGQDMQQQHSEPTWDQTSRLPIQDLPDKQHSWTPKWSH